MHVLVHYSLPDMVEPPWMSRSVRRNRVIIFYKSIPQYRRAFFEKLRERLVSEGIDLELIYGRPAREDAAKGDSVELSWAVKAGSASLRCAGRELIWQKGLARVRPGDLVIVEQASKLLLNYVLFVAGRAGLIHLGFWGHGRSDRLRPLTGVGEFAKRYMSRRVWWWWAYNEQSAAHVRDLGYPDERVTRVQNSIDTRSLTARAASIGRPELADLRERLGLAGDNVCIYVGGMYEDKRLPFLVTACELVHAELPDFEMIFVGDGPESAVVADAAQRHRWIHYVGARFDEERVAYMLLAQLALMPGGVGLGILDSFALRVPLVTCAMASHGPEIDYLRDGQNGLMIAAGSGPIDYAAAVVATLRDAGLRDHLRRGCAQSGTLYTVEAMVDNFAAGVRRALGDPPPSGRSLRSS